MANTFELISSVTVGAGGASSIDFTSIPSTYTDLILKVSARGTTNGGALFVRFNGSSTGYSAKQLYGSGSAVGSGAGGGGTTYLDGGIIGQSTNTANTFSNQELYIPNYAGSNNKSVSVDSVNENNATEAYAIFNADLWSNTAAITSISLTPQNGVTFVQYSTAYLYGVKNA